MPVKYYYGKRTDFVGKTLYEILANLRNFGVNRMLIKQQELLQNPGTICYYIVRKVDPIIAENLTKGAIYAERVFNGSRVPGLVFVEEESRHTDWRLIPRNEESRYLVPEKFLEPRHPDTFEALPRWMKVPPFMNVSFGNHLNTKSLTLAPVRLDTKPLNIRMHHEFKRINEPHKLFRVAEIGEASLLNINKSMSHLLIDPIRPQYTRRRLSSSSALTPAPSGNGENNQKRTLKKKIIDELKHYYHGFRLLFIDLRISSRYVRKILKGEQLSRREHQQLVRSTSDLFRLVPFSVFIIVPFMEFLLPVFLKFFPSMLPSTFQTSQARDAKVKNQLKVKIDMAKFLQQTLDEMAFQAKGESHSEEAKKFAKFFEEVRASGTGASNADILKYSKLFEDEITLDSMTRQQLVACCKLLELQPLGTNVFLRFQLKMRLKALKADDEMIQKEGIKSLTVAELQAACRARGMRALGVPIERLQAQLQQWLELSLDEKIPPSLLLLSRALYVPENMPTSEQLKVTIQSLPELAATEVRYNIGETEGKIDNKTKIEFLKQEEEEIQREELQESVESFKSNYDEALIDKAEEIIERAIKMRQATILKIVKQKSEKNDLTMEFLESVERDLDKLLSDKEELLSGVEHPEEEYDLRELKEEMEDYREEISEKEMQRIRESKAARRLSKRVDRMITNLDGLLDKIESREKAFQEFKKRQKNIAQKYGLNSEDTKPPEKQEQKQSN